MTSPTVVVSGIGVVVAAACLRFLTGAGVVVANQSVMLDDVVLAGGMYLTAI